MCSTSVVGRLVAVALPDHHRHAADLAVGHPAGVVLVEPLGDPGRLAELAAGSRRRSPRVQVDGRPGQRRRNRRPGRWRPRSSHPAARRDRRRGSRGPGGSWWPRRPSRPARSGIGTGWGPSETSTVHRRPVGLRAGGRRGRRADDLAGRDGVVVLLDLGWDEPGRGQGGRGGRVARGGGPVTGGTATGAWPFEVTMVTVEPYGALPVGDGRDDRAGHHRRAVLRGRRPGTLRPGGPPRAPGPRRCRWRTRSGRGW